MVSDSIYIGDRIKRGIYVPERIPPNLNIKSENSLIESAENLCRSVHLTDETPEPCSGSAEPGSAPSHAEQKLYERLKKNEETALRSWATNEDLLLPSAGFIAAWERQQKLRGSEHLVVYDPHQTMVRKFGNISLNNTWLEYFQRQRVHNFLFPEVAYQLLGFSDYEGALHAVLSQPVVVADTEQPASAEEITEHLVGLGFQPKLDPNH